jgi:hypothetical protein
MGRLGVFLFIAASVALGAWLLFHTPAASQTGELHEQVQARRLEAQPQVQLSFRQWSMNLQGWLGGESQAEPSPAAKAVEGPAGQRVSWALQRFWLALREIWLVMRLRFQTAIGAA